MKTYPLSWHTYCSQSGNCSAQTSFGMYVCEKIGHDETGEVIVGMWRPQDGMTDDEYSRHDSHADAVIAAQADYDAAVADIIRDGVDNTPKLDLSQSGTLLRDDDQSGAVLWHATQFECGVFDDVHVMSWPVFSGRPVNPMDCRVTNGKLAIDEFEHGERNCVYQDKIDGVLIWELVEVTDA